MDISHAIVDRRSLVEAPDLGRHEKLIVSGCARCSGKIGAVGLGDTLFFCPVHAD